MGIGVVNTHAAGKGYLVIQLPVNIANYLIMLTIPRVK
jgi:hypothetical protein